MKDDIVTMTVTLTSSEWCEVMSAISSKKINVEKGIYDNDDTMYDDSFDPVKWAYELQSAYDKLEVHMQRNNVVY